MTLYVCIWAKFITLNGAARNQLKIHRKRGVLSLILHRKNQIYRKKHITKYTTEKKTYWKLRDKLLPLMAFRQQAT